MSATPPTLAMLSALKDKLAPTLLKHAAVAGVGIGASAIRVYLSQDDAQIREQIRAAVQRIEPDAPFECVASGTFRALSGKRSEKKPR